MTYSRQRASMIELLEGVEKFNDEVFPANRELFERLAQTQTPKTLFITCADSRIDPALITQQEPGSLFVLRNIGNIVPAYGEVLGGVSSAVEYAVSALKVGHIIVCGHSNCGAMHGLSDPKMTDNMPTVRSWLRNAETACAVARELVAEDSGPEFLQCLAEQNVLLQLSHLRTHPSVAAALTRQELILEGWFYDIPNGQVYVLDEVTRARQPVRVLLQRLREEQVRADASA